MDEETKYKKIAEVAAELDKIGSNKDELSWEEQQALEEYGEIMGQSHQQAQLVTQAQQKLARQRVKSNLGLMQILKEENLSVDDFLRLEAERPQVYQQELSSGMKRYVQRLTGKATGEKAPDPFFDTSRILKPHPKNVERAKAAAKKSKGDDDGVDAVLAALLGE